MSAGLLAVTGATATLGSGNVTVLDAGTGAGGGLLIQTGVLNAIGDNAMLSLSGGSTPDVADVGFAFLEAGVNDRIGALVLGGVAQIERPHLRQHREQRVIQVRRILFRWRQRNSYGGPDGRLQRRRLRERRAIMSCGARARPHTAEIPATTCGGRASANQRQRRGCHC